MEHPEITEGEVTKYWDGNADSWAEQVRNGRDVYREYFNNPAFLKFIGNLNGKTVLDAGYGEGYNTRILAKNGARMVGVDISSRMIELARHSEHQEPMGIRYEMASFSSLPLFEDTFFDTIVSFVALMDGPDYEGALKEFHRLLRGKGELFFSITHPCFLTKGLSWIKDEQANPVKLTVADYFTHQSWLEHWKFSKAEPIPEDIEPFTVPRFPRTLADYINPLIRAGFTLKRIQEPRPSKEMCSKHPWLQRWRDHAALYLYVHAVKL